MSNQLQTEAALSRVKVLEAAINGVLDQSMDDICWMDVYVMLGRLVGREFDPLKLPEHQFRRNCDRFTLDLYQKRPYSRDALTEYMHDLHVVVEEHRQAKQLLDDSGYGVTGTPLLVRLQEALQDATAYQRMQQEDIPGEDN